MASREMSSSCDVTVTLCAVAVSEPAEGEGVGVGVEVVLVVEAAVVETASCAMTILVNKRIAPNAIGNLFMKVVCRSSFQSFCDLFVWHSRLGEAGVKNGASPQMRSAIRRSG